MAKITLFPLYALLMIFALFWNHGNATTPRKLGARHNAVTSLPNTNEAVDSRELVLHFLPFSSSPSQTNVIIPRKQGEETPFRQLSADKDEITTRKIASHFSSSNMWQPLQFEVTPRKLGVRHNAVTSLPNGATTHKLGKRQNPIIITSSQNTNEAVDSRESVLHFLPISSSLTQTKIVIPSEPGMGRGSSIHQLSTDTDETTTRKIKNRFSSSQVLEPIRYFEGNSHN
ncbi:hypothetical protein A4A49_16376 [Nicotiana attenuata]|uniref:Uncharacterized protein n=1 Tax=Nicotiana attenuata TaxID=49451 RepID=A0A314L5Z8_NICAT|nr:hypothetical protein A4A49_16376 [Nicotiana attenuata]